MKTKVRGWLCITCRGDQRYHTGVHAFGQKSIQVRAKSPCGTRELMVKVRFTWKHELLCVVKNTPLRFTLPIPKRSGLTHARTRNGKSLNGRFVPQTCTFILKPKRQKK
jgi:hypothetical protein